MKCAVREGCGGDQKEREREREREREQQKTCRTNKYWLELWQSCLGYKVVWIQENETKKRTERGREREDKSAKWIVLHQKPSLFLPLFSFFLFFSQPPVLCVLRSLGIYIWIDSLSNHEKCFKTVSTLQHIFFLLFFFFIFLWNVFQNISCYLSLLFLNVCFVPVEFEGKIYFVLLYCFMNIWIQLFLAFLFSCFVETVIAWKEWDRMKDELNEMEQ